MRDSVQCSNNHFVSKILLTCAMVAQCLLRLVAYILSGYFNEPHWVFSCSRLSPALTTSKASQEKNTFIRQPLSYMRPDSWIIHEKKEQTLM